MMTQDESGRALSRDSIQRTGQGYANPKQLTVSVGERQNWESDGSTVPLASLQVLHRKYRVVNSSTEGELGNV